MAQTVVNIIRTVLGLVLGVIGLLVFGQGFFMISHVDFPTWDLLLAMLVGMAVGSGLMFGSWRLLSRTLRMGVEPAT